MDYEYSHDVDYFIDYEHNLSPKFEIYVDTDLD
jgi:hypothetical protein